MNRAKKISSINMNILYKRGNLYFSFTQGEVKIFLGSAVSQFPLAQNNYFANVAYIGMAYSGPLHLCKRNEVLLHYLNMILY